MFFSGEAYHSAWGYGRFFHSHRGHKTICDIFLPLLQPYGWIKVKKVALSHLKLVLFHHLVPSISFKNSSTLRWKKQLNCKIAWRLVSVPLYWHWCYSWSSLRYSSQCTTSSGHKISTWTCLQIDFLVRFSRVETKQKHERTKLENQVCFKSFGNLRQRLLFRGTLS